MLGWMILLLIRHALTGQTGKRLYGRTPGVHLSARGRAQAERLAEHLAPVRLQALYSSPMERCVETAREIARGRRLRVRILRDLDEVDYGRWAGRSFKALAGTRLWRRLRWAPSSARFPDGETLREVQHRAVDALEGVAERHPRGAVALVTHGDVVRLALAHYAGIPIDLFQRLEVAAASVSAVALPGDGPPRILRMNDTGALDDLAAAVGG